MAQRAKNPLLSLWQLGLLLRHRFDPWLGNFHMLWVRQKKEDRKKEGKEEREGGTERKKSIKLFKQIT